MQNSNFEGLNLIIEEIEFRFRPGALEETSFYEQSVVPNLNYHVKSWVLNSEGYFSDKLY
jgi:hypothetical protein